MCKFVGLPLYIIQCVHGVCVCACLCGFICILYIDTNLYNDMGMTSVLQGEGDL